MRVATMQMQGHLLDHIEVLFAGLYEAFTTAGSAEEIAQRVFRDLCDHSVASRAVGVDWEQDAGSIKAVDRIGFHFTRLKGN